MFQKLVQPLFKVVRGSGCKTWYIHGAGDLCHIRKIIDDGCRLSSAVEEALPLVDHTQDPVLENNDFDFDRIAMKGGKFLAVHENAAISRKEDNLAFGAAHLGSQSCRKAIPHGSQTAGSNEAAGGCKRKELGGPHLVLPHIGYDDCILIGIGFGSVKECFWCNDAFLGH